MRNINFDDGRPLVFKPADAKTFRGARLRGASLFQAFPKGGTVSLHEFTVDIFELSLLSVHFHEQQTLVFPDPGRFLRMEIVITGELSVSYESKQVHLLPGQYRLTHAENYTQFVKADLGCQLLTLYLTQTLLGQMPMGEKIGPIEPRTMPSAMRELVAEILENSYKDEFLEGFYDHCLRELIFLHLAIPQFKSPGMLSEKVIAAVHAADAIIRENLGRHHKIPELSKMVHLNAFELKTGFSRIFGMGSFERLKHHRLEHAKWRLAHTSDQVQDIAQTAGYANTPALINAFRKKFGLAPLQWRNKQRESPKND